MATTTSLPVAMTTTEAKQVTARIKLLLTSITDATEKVIGLIEQAEAGRAWSALGYDSWAAYVADEYADALAGLARAERIPIAEKLSETGMSVRAIASVTGVGKTTISRDLDEVSRAGTPRTTPCLTTGLDGKQYVRNGRPTSSGVIAITEDVPAPKPKPRKRPLPDSHFDHTWKVYSTVQSLSRLHQDDRFTRTRDAVSIRSAAYLAAAANELLDLLEDLGVDRHKYVVTGS